MSYQISNRESDLQAWRSIDAEKMQELQEKVEFLLELIESYKLELCYKNYELEEIKQELSYTNQELCAALNPKLTINEAMELAKKLLASNKPTEDVLVELLTAIYRSW
jgi:fumarate hydratase class II